MNLQIKVLMCHVHNYMMLKYVVMCMKHILFTIISVYIGLTLVRKNKHDIVKVERCHNFFTFLQIKM